MNPASTTFVLGYHGCDRELAERIFSGRASLKPSHNDYDWLGDGVYFWEHNAQRALEFAREVTVKPRSKRQKIENPAVVGAIIDLGLCLNLLDGRYIEMVRHAYAELVESSLNARLPMPQNSVGVDRLKRDLDCAVIRMAHEIRSGLSEPPFDTVRAAFIEGDRLYPDAGFSAKNHIQICVRDMRCIKGYFRPLSDAGRPIRFSR